MSTRADGKDTPPSNYEAIAVVKGSLLKMQCCSLDIRLRLLSDQTLRKSFCAKIWPMEQTIPFLANSAISAAGAQTTSPSTNILIDSLSFSLFSLCRR